MSLSLFGGKVGVENVSIADDPAFSKSPFITAKSLEVGVELMPLIFSKQLNVTGIVLDEPQITLLKASNGTWNFSSLGGTSKNNPAEPAKSGAPQKPLDRQAGDQRWKAGSRHSQLHCEAAGLRQVKRGS